MSEELTRTAFTDEFTDFPQPTGIQHPGVVADTNLQSGRQTVTLIQPIQQTTMNFSNSDTQNLSGAAVQQQSFHQHQASFPTQMVLGGTQQTPTQYVVQNVAPGSFVQTSNVSGLIPMMAPNVQTMQPQHAQLIPTQGGPPRTVIITQRPVAAGGGATGAPTFINTVTPKVVTLPGIARPILEKKVIRHKSFQTYP